ncbi:MAG: single-stranded DNA-binding protein [Candidatus Paceibacterota bacterium]
MINKVILLGRLTNDPELRQTPSGAKVCTFSMATNRVYKDANGQKKEETTFHKVVAWNKAAEIINEYVLKGHLLYVEGRIENRSYEKDGEKRYTSEVIAGEIKLMPNNRKEEVPTKTTRAVSQKVEKKSKEEDFFDEDVPVIEDGDEIDIKDIPF